MPSTKTQKEDYRGVPPLNADMGSDVIQPNRTVSETAYELRCSPSTVYRLINSGEISAYRRGERTIITHASIQAMKDRNRIEPDDAHIKMGAKIK